MIINYKEKTKEIGYYTITPFYFMHLLTLQEIAVFNVIQNSENLNEKYVSHSVIEFNTLIRKATIPQILKNLIQLDFISVNRITTKGTSYLINWENIYNILLNLIKETNNYQSLIISDNYRVEKGLKSICEVQIKKFKNSEFDCENVQRTIEINENRKSIIKKKNENEEFENKVIDKLNQLAKEKENETDSVKINNINNEINLIKRNLKTRKIKIEFDRLNNTYKIIK